MIAISGFEVGRGQLAAVRRTLEVHDARLNLDGRHARHLRL
jgi:hypothetical protein